MKEPIVENGVYPPTARNELIVQRQGRPIRAWRVHISERRILLMLGDLVATVMSVLIALYVWAQYAQATFSPEFILPHAYWLVILPAVWLLLASANDYYNLRVAARRWTSWIRLASITAQMLVLYLGVFFLSPQGSLPRLFIVYYAAISLVLTGAWRGARLFLIGWTGFRRRALIVGGGRMADLMWRTLKEEASGDYEVLGCVSSIYDVASASLPLDILGTGAELPELIQRHGVAELVIAYINDVPDDVFQGIMVCYELGVEIIPMTRLYEQVTGRILVEHVAEHLWSMVLPGTRDTFFFTLYMVMKRLIDIVLAVVGLVLFSALLPVLALAIKLDSRGPVFYRQFRLGQAGTVFKVRKLRSMVHGAEDQSGPRWAIVGDTRVTHVGKVLRKLRLDELPQLMNVLRGDMSIVGPRPERPEMVADLAAQIPFYRARLAVKPGLTGWAQVRYVYGSSVEDALCKLQYDLYYIRHQSLLLDLMIMLRTIGTLVSLSGV